MYILCGNGIRINVHVTPGAGADELTGQQQGRLKVKLSARAEDGKANRRLCELLAARLQVAKSCVSIHSGQRSRQKVILVEGRPEKLAGSLELLLKRISGAP